MEASTVEIEERGVKLRLTVVDTPGFGDAIDNTDRYDLGVLIYFVYYAFVGTTLNESDIRFLK